MRYFNEYRSVYTLTPAVVQELASRYYYNIDGLLVLTIDGFVK